MDPEARMQYEAREKALKDIASIRGEGFREGKEEGIKEGIMKSRLTIARKMLLKGMNIETIVEITGLTYSEIEELNGDMNG